MAESPVVDACSYNPHLLAQERKKEYVSDRISRLQKRMERESEREKER